MRILAQRAICAALRSKVVFNFGDFGNFGSFGNLLDCLQVFPRAAFLQQQFWHSGTFSELNFHPVVLVKIFLSM
jgi:hypothetical protein